MESRMDLEAAAEAVHNAYLTTCAKLGWAVKPSNQVPYAELSEDSKELDRASVRAVVEYLASIPARSAPEPSQGEGSPSELDTLRDELEEEKTARISAERALEDWLEVHKEFAEAWKASGPDPFAKPSSPSQDSAAAEKEFSDPGEAESPSQWAYRLGLKLDRWIPWNGVDNFQRIENAVLQFVEMKKAPARPSQDSQEVREAAQHLIFIQDRLDEMSGLKREELNHVTIADLLNEKDKARKAVWNLTTAAIIFGKTEDAKVGAEKDAEIDKCQKIILAALAATPSQDSQEVEARVHDILVGFAHAHFLAYGGTQGERADVLKKAREEILALLSQSPKGAAGADLDRPLQYLAEEVDYEDNAHLNAAILAREAWEKFKGGEPSTPKTGLRGAPRQEDGATLDAIRPVIEDIEDSARVAVGGFQGQPTYWTFNVFEDIRKKARALLELLPSKTKPAPGDVGSAGGGQQ